jgi:RNA polymerase sigma-70 factor (ECF subfamily)
MAGLRPSNGICRQAYKENAMTCVKKSGVLTSYEGSLSIFLDVRRNLFGIAYRMLGSVAEAEDIVQNVWLRWQATDQSAVLDPAAFLATTTARLCINLYRSARARREASIESQLTEPLDEGDSPEIGVERMEALKSALGIVAARLRPTERAAYILREAFDYSYSRIAELLNLKEPNVRQILRRARKHILNRRDPSNSFLSGGQLFQAFSEASEHGNFTRLEDLLIAEVQTLDKGARTTENLTILWHPIERKQSKAGHKSRHHRTIKDEEFASESLRVPHPDADQDRVFRDVGLLASAQSARTRQLVCE